MGYHECEFCTGASKNTNRFSNTSSGDVSLTFTNGHSWVMPDMILHYVGDHKWAPPPSFVQDVTDGTLASSGRRQTRGIDVATVKKSTRVGYLTGSIETGKVPDNFIYKLQELMHVGRKNMR